MRIVSGKQVDFFAQGKRGDEGDSAASCWLLTAPAEGRRGSDGNPMGSFNWRQSGSDLDTLNVPQTSKIDLIAARSSDIDPLREWNHVGV